MTVQEKNIAMKTSRSNGASAINKDGTIRAVVPIFVQKNVDKSKSILDFGAGKDMVHTKWLNQNGFNCTAYDLWLNNGNVLNKKYDVVFASNVLNVQSSITMLFETLHQINKALANNGEFICNYPATPRKMISLNTETLRNAIESVFGVRVELVGGTRSAPIWRVRKMLS